MAVYEIYVNVYAKGKMTPKSVVKRIKSPTYVALEKYLRGHDVFQLLCDLPHQLDSTEKVDPDITIGHDGEFVRGDEVNWRALRLSNAAFKAWATRRRW